MTTDKRNDAAPRTASPEVSQPSQVGLSSRAVESLFTRFAAMYGAKFSDHWEGLDHEKVKATWAEGLSDLTRDEILAGIAALVKSGKPFPPTLPEFYGLCRPPIDVPPATDHAGLDALGQRLGVSSANCPSYHAYRARIVERISQMRGVPALTGPKS